MNFLYHPAQLEFRYAFGVSGHTRTHTPVVFCTIEQNGICGYGEAALPPYLGESHESVLNFYRQATDLLSASEINDLQHLHKLLKKIDAVQSGNNAAKAGIDIALHDLLAKTKGLSCAELLGIKKPEPRPLSMTIGIGDEKLIEQKIKEAEAYSILKIKLGTPDDKKLVETVRLFTNKPLMLDVNRGWKTKTEVLEMMDWLRDKNIVFIEQPMPVECGEDMLEIIEKSTVPLIADESVKRLSDIDNALGKFHGINVKLMKSTGMQEALTMMQYAKEKGLKISLGCMSESSCGIAAMAQFMSLADWVDLDGPLLIKNDPFSGIEYRNGLLYPGTGIGTGASPQVSV